VPEVRVVIADDDADALRRLLGGDNAAEQNARLKAFAQTAVDELVGVATCRCIVAATGDKGRTCPRFRRTPVRRARKPLQMRQLHARARFRPGCEVQRGSGVRGSRGQRHKPNTCTHRPLTGNGRALRSGDWS
jgi:hypothetical protein